MWWSLNRFAPVVRSGCQPDLLLGQPRLLNPSLRCFCEHHSISQSFYFPNSNNTNSGGQSKRMRGRVPPAMPMPRLT